MIQSALFYIFCLIWVQYISFSQIIVKDLAMKSPLSTKVQPKNKRPPLPDKPQKKFVYSKQKFSSPQFFLGSSSSGVNRNVLSGIFSPQPKKMDYKRESDYNDDNTLQKNKRLVAVNRIRKDAEETQRFDIKKQVTKNDSFYPIRTNDNRPNHHNFQKLEKSPNEENIFQKKSYLRHKRIQSQPTDFNIIQTPKKQVIIDKKVHFNDPRLTTNAMTLKRKTVKVLQRSLSSSILKNKHKKSRINSVATMQRPKTQSVDSSGSVNSIQVIDDLLTKQQTANLTVRKKYDTVLNNLQNRVRQSRTNINFPSTKKEGTNDAKLKQSEKFTDTLFPPTYSSLFGSLAKLKEGRKGQQIKWVRVQDIFPNHQILVCDTNPNSKSSISIEPSIYGSQYLAAAFNCIKNSRSLLFKMFQKQKYNQFGIYLVRIFQENVWKYVIVDDKIPVVDRTVIQGQEGKKLSKNEVSQAGVVPAFLNLTTRKGANSIQIWPLLLQKAYANYYSNYQSFHLGNEVDYLEELTGMASFVYDFGHITQIKETLAQIQLQLQSSESFGLGQSQQQTAYTPLMSNRSKYPFNDLKGSSKQFQNTLICYDPSNSFKESTLVHQKLPTLFTKVHIFTLQKYRFLSTSIVGHYQSIQNLSKANKRSGVSLRYFRIRQKSAISLSIKQKEIRFYQSSSFKYEYMWVRVILIQRQFNGEYRWITGKYSNQKSVNFQTFLTQGEYFVIIMPEWRQTHCHELTMFLWSNHHKIIVEKQKYDPDQRMIEKACMDLAQRKGKLSQVNAFICSYNYLNQDVGMIIENINNERTIGTVKVMRSINGLKANVEIVPVNKEFYQLSEEELKKGKKEFKNNITISIPQEQSYTVVLKMKGGIDHKFFQVFDFGN